MYLTFPFLVQGLSFNPLALIVTTLTKKLVSQLNISIIYFDSFTAHIKVLCVNVHLAPYLLIETYSLHNPLALWCLVFTKKSYILDKPGFKAAGLFKYV